MRIMVESVNWTWKVATPSGLVRFAVNVPLPVAVRQAGIYGPESITPATAEEHARCLQDERDHHTVAG